jgi:riboflavin biosynthesis pyrimidine reductase
MKVFLVGAMTVCGRISPAVMGSDEDRRHLEELRQRTGASLMGASTLRDGEPEMRTIAGKIPEKRIRAFITRSGVLPGETKKIFTTGPKPVIFTAQKVAAQLQDTLGDRADIIVLPSGPWGLSMQAAVEYFADQDVEFLLIEGGGKLNYAALHEGVVDEVFLTISPFISGDGAAASLVNGPGPLGNPFIKLDMLSCRPAETGELFVRYRVRRS